MNPFLKLLDQLAQSKPLQPNSLRLFKLEDGVIRARQPAPARLPVSTTKRAEGGRRTPRRQRREAD